MNSGRWIFSLALCFVCVSSHDEQYYEVCEDVEACKTQKLAAPLGSSVFLPCPLMTESLNEVLWLQTPELQLVNFYSEGRIRFLDPRSGRLKTFPLLASQGNFSIRIDELEDSDLGCYRCKTNGACLQVELAEETTSKDTWLLMYICVGVAAIILLSLCTYLILSHRKKDTTNPAGASIEGPSAPPQEISAPPVQQQGLDNSVYENDDFDPANYLGHPTRSQVGAAGASHEVNQAEAAPSTSGIYPNLNQFNIEREESQRTKHRFHRELMNRLRQASFTRHYYVNQQELSKQQVTSAGGENQPRGAGKKKKAKDNCEYKNPIYNQSTEQLNQP